MNKPSSTTDLLRVPDVCVLLASRSTLYELAEDADFPPGVHVSKRAVRFHRAEVEDRRTRRIRTPGHSLTYELSHTCGRGLTPPTLRTRLRRFGARRKTTSRSPQARMRLAAASVSHGEENSK